MSSMPIVPPHRPAPTSPWRRASIFLLAFALICAIAPASVFADTITAELDRSNGTSDDTANGSLSLDFDRTGGSDTDPDLEALGMTGSHAYESPQFGYTVEWDDSWELDIEVGLDIAITSDEATTPQRDSLTLRSITADESLRIIGSTIDESVFDPDGDIPRQHVELYEAYADGKHLKNTPIESIDLLLADYDDDYGSAVYLITWDDGDQFLFHNQIQVIGDIVVTTLLSTAPGTSFLRAYTAAIDGVEIAGDPAFPLLDEVEVEEVVLVFLDEIVSDPDPDEDDEDDSGGSSGDDAADYLDDVRDHVDELQASYDRFSDILSSGGALTEEEADFLNETVGLWIDAPSIADDLEPPAGLEELHEAYLDYADALADMAEAFVDFVLAEQGSTERDEAIAAFHDARIVAADLGEELEDLLSDAGV